MKFFWDFVSDREQISASTENPEFPVENLQDERRKRIYRTGTSQASEWIMVYSLSGITAKAIILLDHTLTQADFDAEAWKLQANNTDSWGAPALDESFAAFQTGRAILELDNEATYNFWRFKYTKSAAAQSRDFGRLFLGPVLDTGYLGDPKWGGYAKSIEDPSEVTETIGRQKLTYVQEKNKSWKMDFGGSPDSVVDELEYMISQIGRAKPFFHRVFDTGSISRVEYGRFRDLPDFQNVSKDSEYYWDHKLNIDEEI